VPDDQPVTIWFNPSCSKCRGALEILESRGVEPEITRYLDDPPTAEEIRDVLVKLGLGPRDLVRTGEPIYAELGLADATDDELIEAMAANPILIERPVVIKGGRAIIGRPPERIHELVE
jgi:arsenate reductase (glutaredoxin)